MAKFQTVSDLSELPTLLEPQGPFETYLILLQSLYKLKNKNRIYVLLIRFCINLIKKVYVFVYTDFTNKTKTTGCDLILLFLTNNPSAEHSCT